MRERVNRFMNQRDAADMACAQREYLGAMGNSGLIQHDSPSARLQHKRPDVFESTMLGVQSPFGLVNAANQRLFPNAKVYLSQADFDFWTDEKKVEDKALGAFVKHARLNLMPYKGRTKFVTDGKEVIPGVTAMSAPGHTVGHTIYLIQSAGKTMAFTGDTTHHQILLTEKPRTEFAYDSDPKAAVASRLKVFDMLAKDRIPMLAFHFPWPGYGYLGRQGADSYRYFAQPMTIVPIPAKKA